MNKDMKEAKFWLNRNYLFTRKVMADKRTLEKLENQLGSGVAKYESDGSGGLDQDAARKRHEDALIDYSEILSRLQMWNLKKNGFHIYAIAQILILIITAIFVAGVTGASMVSPAILTAIWIGIYFIYYRKALQ